MDEKAVLRKIGVLVRGFAAREPRYRGITLPFRSMADLDRLPLMTRRDLKAFVAAGPLSGAFNVTATSGSTAARLLIAHSETAHRVHVERLRKIYAAVGAGPGVMCLNLCSHELNSGGRLMEAGYKAAGSGIIPLGGWGTPAQADEAVRLIRVFRPAIVNAYTNQLPELFEALGKDHPVKKCVVNGEPLWEEYRRRIEKAGRVAVHDHYGAMEVSGLAIALRSRDTHMRIFPDGLLVEVRRDDGRIADDGLGELLVTDLENTCMPFVRYCLGDRVEVVRRRGQQEVRVLSRTRDSLLVNGVVVMKSVLVRTVNDLLGHPRFYFSLYKDPATYKDILTVHVPPERAASGKVLADVIVRATGMDHCVALQAANGDIPRTPNGKIRYFIDDQEKSA